MSGDNPEPVPALEQIIDESGIPFPNVVPYSHITLAMVAWNEAQRLPTLLHYLRPYFVTIAIGVQESGDGTLAIARELADIVVEDTHSGFGDTTFGPKLLPEVRTPWTFKIDCDERPVELLLDGLSNATWWADHRAQTSGVWIPFHSSVDEIEYTEQHAHLRLFHTTVGWPGYLHSRPPIQDGILWQTGWINHDRSLDEMMQDYLRYLAASGNPGHVAHNRLMIKSACTGTAEVKGWDYVKAFPWWPQVEEIVNA